MKNRIDANDLLGEGDLTLDEVWRMIATICCPFCSATDFELKLRCDLGYERCLQTVRCRKCGHEFDAVALIKSQDHWAD